MDERVYCSQLNQAEPLAGTADTVGAWLLLEYRPVWKAKAQADNSLAPRTRAWLADSLAALAEQGIRARPQFIRQPELDGNDIRLFLGLPGRLLAFSGATYDALATLDVAALLGDPARAAEHTLTDPHYFVCTNGQRDACCARYGLPVYAALRQRVGARVWQITHVGGHRFAPNVLVLPQGGLYGRVALDTVAGFVGAIEARELAFAQLRGCTFQPKHVQAAEAFAGRSDLRLLRVDGDATRARVCFTSADTVVEVEVERAQDGLTVLASCSDELPDVVFPYQCAWPAAALPQAER